MSIFARFANRFSVRKIPASKMIDITPEIYEALLIYDDQLAELIDITSYRVLKKIAV